MNDIQAELEMLAEENNGLLLPERVVEFAQDPNTALHDQFEWDDTKAGHQHRLWQARKIIRALVNVITTPEGERRIHAFVSMNDDRHGDGGYRTMVSVMSDAESREALLEQAYNEFKAWQKRYKDLQELTPIFEAAKRIVRKKKL